MKKKTILIIDTSNSEEISVGIKINKQMTILKSKSEKYRAQMVLPLMEKILKKKKLKIQDLTGIKINRGPGSFTGLKVGLTIANTLSWVLQIPINNYKIGKIVTPKYEE